MPYISDYSKRDNIAKLNDDIVQFIECSGDLNYTITDLLFKVIAKNDLNYDTINNIIGAMECAKLELYRTTAAPYEDIKRKQNGDLCIPREE